MLQKVLFKACEAQILLLDLYNILVDPVHKTSQNNLFTNIAVFYDAFMVHFWKLKNFVSILHRRKGEINAILENYSCVHGRKQVIQVWKQHEE